VTVPVPPAWPAIVTTKLYEMPQVVPSHVAVPPAAVGQGVHEAPQVATLVFELQVVPHA
jgi:hypothetical protein